jgi:DNA-binding transcriptional regulator YiaG
MSKVLETKAKRLTAKRPTARRRGSAGGKPARGGSPQLSPAGAKIVAAFEETIATMRSGGLSGKRLTIRTYKMDFTPRDYGPEDVRRVRGLLGMSQAVFARFLGVDANTVRSWEQGTRPPSPIARRFMDEVEADVEHWRARIVQSIVGAESKRPAG